MLYNFLLTVSLTHWYFIYHWFTISVFILFFVASNRITPVFAISSVTGLGVDLLRSFVGKMLTNIWEQCSIKYSSNCLRKYLIRCNHYVGIKKQITDIWFMDIILLLWWWISSDFLFMLTNDPSFLSFDNLSDIESRI